MQIQRFLRFGNVWAAAVCCPGMVRIAARARPSLSGVVLLTGIAAVPWAEQHQHRVTETAVDIVQSTERACSGLCIESTPRASAGGIVAPSAGGIVLTPWDRVELGPQHFEILVPPTHPDAQDWPRGMVIGRNTPSVDPGIQLWFESPFANVMSVFLAPWRALAGQLGT